MVIIIILLILVAGGLGYLLYQAKNENAVLEGQIATIVADSSQGKTFAEIYKDLEEIKQKIDSIKVEPPAKPECLFQKPECNCNFQKTDTSELLHAVTVLLNAINEIPEKIREVFENTTLFVEKPPIQ